MSDETLSTARKPWQFQPGNNANPTGRPRGSRNKLGEDFIQALHGDFQEHGVGVIEQVRVERPHEYLKVIASILPKVLEIKDDAFDGIEREHLAALIVAARQALGVAESGRERTSEAPGTQSLN